MVEFSMYSVGSASFLHEVFNGLAMIQGAATSSSACRSVF